MTDKLTFDQVQFLRLIKRSPADVDGWRKVSAMLAALVEKFATQMPELVEVSYENGLQVRLTESGTAVEKYVTAPIQ